MHLRVNTALADTPCCTSQDFLVDRSTGKLRGVRLMVDQVGVGGGAGGQVCGKGQAGPERVCVWEGVGEETAGRAWGGGGRQGRWGWVGPGEGGQVGYRVGGWGARRQGA